MSMRYLIAGVLLATTSTGAWACPDCAGDYAAWMEDQALANDDEAAKLAFQQYEAEKMAQAKATFLAKFKPAAMTETTASLADVSKEPAK